MELIRKEQRYLGQEVAVACNTIRNTNRLPIREKDEKEVFNKVNALYDRICKVITSPIHYASIENLLIDCYFEVARNLEDKIVEIVKKKGLKYSDLCAKIGAYNKSSQGTVELTPAEKDLCKCITKLNEINGIHYVKFSRPLPNFNWDDRHKLVILSEALEYISRIKIDSIEQAQKLYQKTLIIGEQVIKSAKKIGLDYKVIMVSIDDVYILGTTNRDIMLVASCAMGMQTCGKKFEEYMPHEEMEKFRRKYGLARENCNF